MVGWKGKISAAPAREGACVVGLKDKLKKYNDEHKEDGFHPLELTESNVQAIFNRCLRVPGCPEVCCELFPPVLGYSSKDYRSTYGFDEKAISIKRIYSICLDNCILFTSKKMF